MDYFRETLEGLKQTAEGLIVANEGFKRAVEAALAARSEQEEIRETVHRLDAHDYVSSACGRNARGLRRIIAVVDVIPSFS